MKVEHITKQTHLPDSSQALEDFRLAPLCARRNIAMLGALHKINLGLAPKQLSDMFPMAGAARDISHWPSFRRIRPLHSRQLFTHCKHNSTDVMKASLFGLVHCYNVLPQNAVDQRSNCSIEYYSGHFCSFRNPALKTGHGCTRRHGKDSREFTLTISFEM